MKEDLSKQDGSEEDSEEETIRLTQSNRIVRYAGNQFFGRVLLLNAPMGCGKDFVAERVALSLGCDHKEFKEKIFNIAMAMTGLNHYDFFEIYEDRDKKEYPQPKFMGLSPRNLMISISEDMCKPIFGKGYFGKSASQGVDCNIGAVFSDSGFHEEVTPLVDRFGADNIYVCRFTRGGAKFNSTDSRDYLDPSICPKGIKFLPFMENDGDIQEFCNTITEYVMTY